MERFFTDILPYLLFFGGFALIVFALKYRSNKRPEMTPYRIIDYVMVWKQRSWYDPPGYLITSIGNGLMLCGAFFKLIISVF